MSHRTQVVAADPVCVLHMGSNGNLEWERSDSEKLCQWSRRTLS